MIHFEIDEKQLVATSSHYYRFVWNNLGFYDTQEFSDKETGLSTGAFPKGEIQSWYADLGNYSTEAKAYWTYVGLQKYLKSGLQDLHRRKLGNHLCIEVLKRSENVMYRDENQILCSKETRGETFSWDAFVRSELKSPIKKKVVIFVVRTAKQGDEILVFEHSKEWSEAGIQVPAGSIEDCETLEEAAFREVFEETGLQKHVFENEVAWIDETLLYRHIQSQFQIRYFCVFKVSRPVSNRWVHVVSGDGFDASMEYTCFWVPKIQAMKTLAGGFGDSISKIPK